MVQEITNNQMISRVDRGMGSGIDGVIKATGAAGMVGMSPVNAVFPNMNDEMDLDDYEIVGAEFFAQIKEPAFTVNVNKVTVNAASVRLLPDVDYVKILIKRDEKKLVLKPCTENDIYGYKWARDKDGKRYASQRTGEPFVLILCGIMGWNPDNRYKILGKRMYSKGEAILVFDLTVAQCFEKAPAGEDGKAPRRTALPAGWNGRFGPTYGENRRTLQVDTFEGYSVISIKGKSNAADKDGAAEEESAAGEESISREDSVVGEDNMVGDESTAGIESAVGAVSASNAHPAEQNAAGSDIETGNDTDTDIIAVSQDTVPLEDDRGKGL